MRFHIKLHIYIIMLFVALTELAYYKEKAWVDSVSPKLPTSLILPYDIGSIICVGIFGAFIGLCVARLVYCALPKSIKNKDVESACTNEEHSKQGE